MVGEIEFVDPCLDDVAKRSVSDKSEFEVDTVATQRRGRLEKSQMAFLLGEPRHAEQHPPAGGLYIRAMKIVAVETAMDDMYLVPIFESGPSHQLASPEGTHCRDEGRGGHLGPKTVFIGAVEFLRPVDSETEGYGGKLVHKRANGGRVRSEVHMQVFDPIASTPVCDDESLREIS